MNPDHIFEGTKKDNSRDMAAKGRCGKFPKHGAHNGFSKLDDDKVRAIRAAYASGASLSDLGRAYSVYPSAIYKVVSRESWRHVE